MFRFARPSIDSESLKRSMADEFTFRDSIISTRRGCYPASSREEAEALQRIKHKAGLCCIFRHWEFQGTWMVSWWPPGANLKGR